MAIVKKDGFYGLMNVQSNKLLFPFEYDVITIRGGRLIRAEKEGKTIAFKMDGTPLGLEYDAMVWMGGGYFGVLKNGKKGVVSDTGKEVLPIIYEEINLANIFVPGFFKATLNGETNLIDIHGNTRTEEEINLMEKEIRASENKEPGKPNEPAPDKGIELSPYLGDYGEGQGYRDENGRLVVSPVYQEVGYFIQGYSVVMNNGKMGLIDQTGKVVLPLIFEDLSVGFEDDPLIRVKFFGKWGVLRRVGI